MHRVNEKATITVSTPSGDTREFEVKEIVKQGTTSSPLLCYVEIRSVNEIGEGVEVNHGGNLKISVPIFMDYINATAKADGIKKVSETVRK